MPDNDDDDVPSLSALQPPTRAAVQRAKPLFNRLLSEMRGEPTRGPTASMTPQAQPPSPPMPPSARRYDLALAKAGLAPGSTNPGAPTGQPVYFDDDPTEIAQQPREAARQHQAPLPSRPPTGAPMVRAPVRKPPAGVLPDFDEVEGNTRSAQLRSDRDGTMSFDITFEDHVFANLRCTISVLDGRATATFHASDPNTRRLIDAEAGRLRDGLQARGLKVETVIVVTEDQDVSNRKGL